MHSLDLMAASYTLVIFSIICRASSIIVTEKYQLDSLLCHNGFRAVTPTTIYLYTNITHTINSNKQCHVDVVSPSLVISSEDPSNYAVIQCFSASQTTSGFVFTSTIIQNAYLKMQRVKIINCGANLTLLDEAVLNSINSTGPFYFTNHHASVLIFSGLYSISLYNVTISNYYGFAMIAHNLPNGLFDTIKVMYSTILQQSNFNIGSGALMLYNNKQSTNRFLQYSLSFVASVFAFNAGAGSNFRCITSVNESFDDYCGPVIYAGGLTLLYSQCDLPAHVSILKCNFSHNFGLASTGAILIMHQNAHPQSQTIVNEKTVFEKQSNLWQCHGGAIVLIVSFSKGTSCSISHGHSHYPLVINSAVFTDNGRSGIIPMGSVFICTINSASTPVHYHFRNVTFEFNFATSKGSCLYANTYNSSNVEVILESMHVHNNSSPEHSYAIHTYHLTPVFEIHDFYMITINGSKKHPGMFSNNFGTVFNVLRSNITLSGHVTFANNLGINGGVIMLLGPNNIYLKKGLKATFFANQVQLLGGAIYADTGNIYSKGKCTFQLLSKDFTDVSIKLIGNKASVAGNAIYTSSAYNCLMDSISSSISNHQLMNIYKTIFSAAYVDIEKVISANAVAITLCTTKSYSIYPGQTFSISMRAIDAINNSAFAVVTFSAAVASYDGPKRVHWWFADREKVQVIQEKNFNQCTLISITVHTKLETDTVNKNGHEAFLLFSLLNGYSLQKVVVHLRPCPTGFMLDSADKGVCVCSNFIHKLSDNPRFRPQCNISTQSFSKPNPSSWAGNVILKENITLAVSSSCYENYCRTSSMADSFILNSTGSFIQNSQTLHTETVCSDFRNGTICGHCQEGYSVVFGSTECKKCKNWWLLILFAYAIVGPLFIYILFALKITLTTGIFNGIIFFAQATLVGVFDYLNSKPNILHFFQKTFLSILNLRISIPICFYNGMTEILKSGFGLLFPVYLLTIVVGLIILSQYSAKVANKIADSSVQVLITVVHLSFTKLLSTIIFVLTPATIYTEHGHYTVWYYDGTVDYGSKGHIILITVTLATVFTLLFPYLLLLLLPKSLRQSQRKLNEWSRPILESLYAPYKQGRQYWFVGRLLMLIFMYLLFAVKPYSLVIFVQLYWYSLPFYKLYSILTRANGTMDLTVG